MGWLIVGIVVVPAAAVALRRRRRRGTSSVDPAGLGHQHENKSFGEHGDTATVTAKSAATLWTVERDAFLAAIGAATLSREVADEHARGYR